VSPTWGPETLEPWLLWMCLGLGISAPLVLGAGNKSRAVKVRESKNRTNIGLAWLWPVLLGSFLAGMVVGGLAILGMHKL
jgi:hypothetical protein